MSGRLPKINGARHASSISELSRQHNQHKCSAACGSIYSWVLLLACFIQLGLSMGLAFSVGPLIYHWLQMWQLGQQNTAFVGSINIGLMFLSGPIAAALRARLNFRLAVLMGSLLSASGLLASAFISHLYVLYITYGVVTGVGFGIVYSLSSVYPAFIFTKHRVLALGVASAGVGVGNLIFPPLLQLLIEQQGWRSAMVWCSALALQGCVLAALLKLPTVPDNTPRPALCDFNVVKNPLFILFFLCNFLWNTGSIFVSVLLVDYAKQRGLSAEQGSQLVAVIGVSSLLLRLPVALFAEKWPHSLIHLYCLGAVIRGLGTLLLPMMNTLPWSIFCAALHGGGFGMQLALLYPVILELFPLQLAPSVGGYGLVSAGIGALTGPPLAGWLYSLNNSYILPFYLGAVMTMCSVIPMYTALYLSTHGSRVPGDMVVVELQCPENEDLNQPGPDNS